MHEECGISVCCLCCYSVLNYITLQEILIQTSALRGGPCRITKLHALERTGQSSMKFINFRVLSMRINKPSLCKRSQNTSETIHEENQYMKTLTLFTETSSPNNQTGCQLSVLKLMLSSMACCYLLFYEGLQLFHNIAQALSPLVVQLN